MPDKSKLKTQEVQFWLAEAKSCDERQKRELRERNNYPFLINYYEGAEKVDATYPHVASQRQMAIINEYFPNTNALITELMFQNPDILLDALKPSAEEELPVMKAALTYLMNKSDSLIENRIALFDMLYAGYCCVEVDQIDDRVKPSVDPGVTEEQPQEKKSVFDKFAKAIGSEKEAEERFAKLSPPIEANFSTVQGTYIRRYNPMDVPLDWRAMRLRDRRYNLKRVWLSKEEFDVKYPDFKDKVSVGSDRFDHSRHDMMQHSSKIMLWEFQLRLVGDKYRTIILSDQIKIGEIDTFERPYDTNGFNMKIGTLHKYGVLYPISFAQINRKMQDELNHYVKHMMEVAERNVPKYVADKNKVKSDALDALKSNRVNDIAMIDGNTSGAVTPLPATNVSLENKEVLSILQDQKNKLWTVSETRISGRSQSKFATDLVIQEESFKESNLDIQEGLRLLYREELETGKDLIVTFWDGEVFLKVTGHPKITWYEPETIQDPNGGDQSIVSNPLTDLLTGDYQIDIDISSARRKNREQELNNMIFYMGRLVEMRELIISQGQDINIDEIKRISKEFGLNPDKIFIPHTPAEQPSVPTAGGETLSPEEDASRQAQAEAQVGGGGGGGVPGGAVAQEQAV